MRWCVLSSHCKYILVKHPIMIRVDEGKNFMTGNVIAVSHTKLVNLRYKYENKYIKVGIIKMVLVKSAENDSKILRIWIECFIRSLAENDSWEAWIITKSQIYSNIKKRLLGMMFYHWIFSLRLFLKAGKVWHVGRSSQAV